MRKLIVDGEHAQAAALAAVLTAAGIDALPAPKRVPVRQLTEADAERIAAAQAKRERKAIKRAARTQGGTKP